MPMIFLQQELGIAQAHCQRDVGSQKQLRKQGPGDRIILCHVRHLPVDPLIEPSLYDNLDAGLGISIRSSHTLQGVTSGWWGW